MQQGKQSVDYNRSSPSSSSSVKEIEEMEFDSAPIGAKDKVSHDLIIGSKFVVDVAVKTRLGVQSSKNGIYLQGSLFQFVHVSVLSICAMKKVKGSIQQ